MHVLQLIPTKTLLDLQLAYSCPAQQLNQSMALAWSMLSINYGLFQRSSPIRRRACSNVQWRNYERQTDALLPGIHHGILRNCAKVEKWLTISTIVALMPQFYHGMWRKNSNWTVQNRGSYIAMPHNRIGLKQTQRNLTDCTVKKEEKNDNFLRIAGITEHNDSLQ